MPAARKRASANRRHVVPRNTKFEAPNRKQITNSKSQTRMPTRTKRLSARCDTHRTFWISGFKILSLFRICDLGFRIFSCWATQNRARAFGGRAFGGRAGRTRFRQRASRAGSGPAVRWPVTCQIGPDGLSSQQSSSTSRIPGRPDRVVLDCVLRDRVLPDESLLACAKRPCH